MATNHCINVMFSELLWKKIVADQVAFLPWHLHFVFILSKTQTFRQDLSGPATCQGSRGQELQEENEHWLHTRASSFQLVSPQTPPQDAVQLPDTYWRLQVGLRGALSFVQACSPLKYISQATRGVEWGTQADREKVVWPKMKGKLGKLDTTHQSQAGVEGRSSPCAQAQDLAADATGHHFFFCHFNPGMIPLLPANAGCQHVHSLSCSTSGCIVRPAGGKAPPAPLLQPQPPASWGPYRPLLLILPGESAKFPPPNLQGLQLSYSYTETTRVAGRCPMLGRQISFRASSALQGWFLATTTACRSPHIQTYLTAEDQHLASGRWSGVGKWQACCHAAMLNWKCYQNNCKWPTVGTGKRMKGND